MHFTPRPEPAEHANREKSWVAFSSLMAAIFLTGTKLGIGIWTNSLGILSEAAHSGLDLVAAGVTLWAVRIASKPADHEHTYGHGKFENLSALFETLLLLVTCIWIIYEAVHRLFFAAEGVHVDPNFWAFAIVIVSIIIDISRSRALKRAADKYNSQALEADALHFSTDVWSSCVVFLGLVGVVIAEKFDMPLLMMADAVAALGVAGIVIVVSFQLGKKSIDDLLDRIPDEMYHQVEEAVHQVEGIDEVHQVRLRRSGAEIFADVTLSIRRSVAFERVHDISEAVEDAVRKVLPGTDVVVHAEPNVPESEELTTTVRLLAARFGLAAHAVRIYDKENERWLELHLEVSESLRLDEAHELASRFEAELRTAIPGLERIVTHLEPAGDATAIIPAQTVDQANIQKLLDRYQKENQLSLSPHHIEVQQTGKEQVVSFHCRLAPATPIADAHDFTVKLEEYLKKHLPKITRVVIHAEPEKPKG